MRRFSDWFVYRGEYLTFASATVLSLILIFSNNDPRLRTIRSYAFGSFGYVLEKATALQRYDHVYRHNRWLRKENARLMLENTQYKEAVYENERLRSLLEFKAKSQLELLPAKVIGEEENGFIHSIVLDVGENSGAKKNMAVVTSQGLVGRIYEVSAANSIVLLMLDRNFRVGSMLQRSRIAGIVKWESGNEVVLAQIAKRSDVSVGDAVITSGFSTIFPGGLQVGKIVRTSADEQGMFMTVVVKPAVDFSKLEEVFIVKMLPAVMAAGQEEK